MHTQKSLTILTTVQNYDGRIEDVNVVRRERGMRRDE